MSKQDIPSDNKLESNWKTVVVVGAILLAGAVGGHSLLTQKSIDVGCTADKTSCQACPSNSAKAIVDDSNDSEPNQVPTTCSSQRSGCPLSSGSK